MFHCHIKPFCGYFQEYSRDILVDKRLNRRDFLNLLTLLPLLQIQRRARAFDSSRLHENSGKPNVLSLLIDALSALHLPLHGYSRNTTPNLVRFADRATVFHQHHAAGNFTTPGTDSLFTGTYPWTHRALNLHGTITSDFEYRNFFHLPCRCFHFRLFTQFTARFLIPTVSRRSGHAETDRRAQPGR